MQITHALVGLPPDDACLLLAEMTAALGLRVGMGPDEITDTVLSLCVSILEQDYGVVFDAEPEPAE